MYGMVYGKYVCILVYDINIQDYIIDIKSKSSPARLLLCYGDEENGQCACTGVHLTTANQLIEHALRVLSLFRNLCHMLYFVYGANALPAKYTEILNLRSDILL